MLWDAIIVGGSFAGISAALQLGRARRRVLVIDAGLPRNRFARTSHGFFGLDGERPADMVARAGRQLLAYDTVSLIRRTAVDVVAEGDAVAVHLDDGSVERAARLILASGVKDHLPDVPGLEPRWGRSVLHCPYCHGYEIGQRPIGVLAAGEMSVHQAALVADWGPVTLFTQGCLDLSEAQHALLSERGVAIETGVISELCGNGDTLDQIRLVDGRLVDAAALFVVPRTELTSDLAVRLGCALEQGPTGPFIRVDERKQTSVARIFAAGDAAAPMPNAALAAAAGVLAGGSAHQSLIFG